MRVIVYVGMNSVGEKGIRLDVVRPDGQAEFVWLSSGDSP